MHVNSTKVKFLLVISIIALTLASFSLLITPAYAQSTFSSTDKGIQWHMGYWYVNGAYNWTGMNADLDKMASGGMNWIRFSFGSHTQSQCSSTGFYTRLANEFAKRGLHGLASINIPNNKTTTATLSELDSYKNWLATMVNCYKDKFDNWGVWNEPNYHLFWNIDERTTDDTAYAKSVGYYISYLKVTYETIKSLDPNANVVLGGITQNWNITLSDGRTIGTMTRWMDEFIKQGGYQYIDTWGFHPYADYDPSRTYSYNGYTGCGTDNIKRIDEFKAKAHSTAIPLAHRNKPIWLTEVGFTVTSDQFPGNTKGSESVKAQCLKDTWEKFREHGITLPPIWYEFSQDNLSNDRQLGYSLVPSNKTTGEFRYNESYYTYKNLWSTTSTSTHVSDNFTRTLTGGWGTADTGGTYSYSPSTSSSNFSVNGSSGAMSVSTANTQRIASLSSVSARDVDIKVRVKTDKLPNGGIFLAGLEARNGTSGNYRPVLRYEGGKLYIQAQKYLTETGAVTDLSAKQEITGQSHLADNYYWIRAQVIGTNPTTINIKAWHLNETEPAGWQYTVSDNSTTQITSAGSVGLLSRVSLGNSDVPVVFSYDEYKITSPVSTTATPTMTLTPIPGDINGDGIVNLLDFTLLSNAFGTTDASADLNSDGIVNVLDFTILSNNFGKSN